MYTHSCFLFYNYRLFDCETEVSRVRDGRQNMILTLNASVTNRFRLCLLHDCKALLISSVFQTELVYFLKIYDVTCSY